MTDHKRLVAACAWVGITTQTYPRCSACNTSRIGSDIYGEPCGLCPACADAMPGSLRPPADLLAELEGHFGHLGFRVDRYHGHWSACYCDRRDETDVPYLNGKSGGIEGHGATEEEARIKAAVAAVDKMKGKP